MISSTKTLIKDLYFEENFHNIKVEILLKDNNTDYSKNVEILINEGKKIKIKKIKINGNKSFSKNKILKNFENIKESRWYKFWQGNYNKKKLDDDIKNLTNFYKNNGYRDVQIVSYEAIIKEKEIIVEILLLKVTIFLLIKNF